MYTLHWQGSRLPWRTPAGWVSRQNPNPNPKFLSTTNIMAPLNPLTQPLPVPTGSWIKTLDGERITDKYHMNTVYLDISNANYIAKFNLSQWINARVQYVTALVHSRDWRRKLEATVEYIQYTQKNPGRNNTLRMQSIPMDVCMNYEAHTHKPP